METIIAQIVTEMVNNIFDHIKKVGISNLSIMGTALQQDANTCILKILKAIIEKTDSLLLENKKLRKIDRLTVQQRNVSRTFLTVFGALTYERTYYSYLSEDGQARYAYLTDEVIGIESYERISKDLIAEILSDLDTLSYRKAAGNHEGDITAQTVHNRLLAAEEFSSSTEKLEKPENGLDIFADEDHVHMQPKKNEMVPLVTVTEGIQGGKTVHPFFLEGYGMSSEALAENTLALICERYGSDIPSPIRLHCDGGNWIKTLKDVLPGAESYMDGFHVQKYLKKLLNLKDGSKYAQRMRNALKNCDWDSFFLYGAELIGLQEEDKKEKAEKLLNYFYNNQESIERRMKAEENGVCGSCTEGQVSHVFSERLSRDPLSWSEEGLRKMSSLLVYRKNGNRVTSEQINVSTSKDSFLEKKLRFKENGFEKYCNYAKVQTETFLQKHYDWSALEPACPTYGKIDGTQVILSALGKVRDTICA